jgi:hypothetical protein
VLDTGAGPDVQADRRRIGQVAIEEDHQLSKQAAGLDAGQVIRWKSWHRWTAIGLLAYIYLAVTVALQHEQDAGPDLDAGLIPVTVPELLRLLRDIVIPPPRRDRAHRLHWSDWRRRHQHRARELTDAGTPTPSQHHDHNELQLPELTAVVSRWLLRNVTAGTQNRCLRVCCARHKHVRPPIVSTAMAALSAPATRS